VIELDSSLAPAAIHPLEVATAMGDTVMIRRYETVFRSAESSTELRRAQLARRAVSGDDSALVALFESPSGLSLAAFQNRMSRASGDEVLDLALRISATAPEGPAGIQLRALPGMIAQALGQTDSALAILANADLGAQYQEMRSYVRLIPLLSGYADPALLRLADSAIGRNHLNQYVAVWQGLMALDLGDPARAYSFVGRVLARPDTLQRFVHGALYGVQGLALVAQGDTARGIAVLDSARVLMGGTNAVNFVTPIEMRYAMLLSSMPTTRRRGINHLTYGFSETGQVYPIVQYYLGRAWEAEGRLDSAAVAYSRFLRLWNNADSLYQPMLAQARDAVERASTEGQAATP
jgi:tetratricopeptide (TPR) repeat protein